MAEMLLDMTLFNDLRRGDTEARKVIEAILDGGVKAAVSPMTVFELWQSDEIDRRTEIAYLSVLRFVEEAMPDTEIARTAGLLLADSLEDSPRDASCISLVAATAIRLDIPICTRDAEAFERFDVEIRAY